MEHPQVSQDVDPRRPRPTIQPAAVSQAPGTQMQPTKDPRPARPQEPAPTHGPPSPPPSDAPQSAPSAVEAYDPPAVPAQSAYDHKPGGGYAPTGSVHGLGNAQPSQQAAQFGHMPQPDAKPKMGAAYGPTGGIPPSSGGSKIFVGGLSWETDETSLRRYFEQYGAVLDCVIMRDRHTGHPRGFGFVTFQDDAVAARAAARRHDLDGRQVEAKRAVPRNEFHAPNTGYQRAQRHTDQDAGGHAGGGRGHHTTRCKLFVGGLPAQCGEAEFKDYFQSFGEVVEAQVMIDHNTGNSRGFGFVTFLSEETVEQVVGPGRSNTRHEIMGKSVEVKRAEPKGASAGGRRDGARNSGQSAGGGGGDQGGAAASAAAAYYNNYPAASLAEQYGAYYNNPQWQQYYAAMGYNFNAYPQGYNPYSYLQAYMNNVSSNGAVPQGEAGAAGAGGGGNAAGGQAPQDGSGKRSLFPVCRVCIHSSPRTELTPFLSPFVRHPTSLRFLRSLRFGILVPLAYLWRPFHAFFAFFLPFFNRLRGVRKRRSRHGALRRRRRRRLRQRSAKLRRRRRQQWRRRWWRRIGRKALVPA